MRGIGKMRHITYDMTYEDLTCRDVIRSKNCYKRKKMTLDKLREKNRREQIAAMIGMCSPKQKVLYKEFTYLAIDMEGGDRTEKWRELEKEVDTIQIHCLD